MIPWSRGRSRHDATPEQRASATFTEFVAAIAADRAQHKETAAYFCGPFNGNGRRCKDGVEPVSFVVLDADRIDPDVLPDLRMWLARFQGVGWPTHSSTTDSPHERAVIELSRPVTRDESIRIGAALTRDLAEEFGSAVEIDPSTFKPEQPVFVPPVGVMLARYLGDPLDVDAYLRVAPEAELPPEQEPASDEIPDHQRNIRLASLGGSLRRIGLDADEILGALRVINSKRCRPPLEDAEVAGVARKMAKYAPQSQPSWPVLKPEALHGLAGRYVNAIKDDTEADPAAILFHFMGFFGAHVGSGPHIEVEGARHGANLFALLVGQTSKSRKGTSEKRARQPFNQVEGFPKPVSGLTSGEGLKYHVRDPLGADPGIADKRLLVIEPEFAQVLRTASRKGVTLSAAVREAWDSGNLRTLTRHDPIVATGAHISVIAHITVEELRQELTATDQANGFANRFLFVAVRRARLLPFGGQGIEKCVIGKFAGEIEQAAGKAKGLGEIKFDTVARATWERIYAELAEGLPGLVGAVTARAEAQVLRLALIYTLLDQSAVIGDQHLAAARALWQYCEESARYIFGGRLGNDVADRILTALRVAGEQGMSRTELSEKVFDRNVDAGRIEAALALLAQHGLARKVKVGTGEAGRPTERWYALTKETN